MKLARKMVKSILVACVVLRRRFYVKVLLTSNCLRPPPLDGQWAKMYRLKRYFHHRCPLIGRCPSACQAGEWQATEARGGRDFNRRNLRRHPHASGENPKIKSCLTREAAFSIFYFFFCGPGWVRTSDQAVMHPTSAFAAPFGFVGWTIPSPRSSFRFRRCLPSSLYTFPEIRAWLGIAISASHLDLQKQVSPNLTGFTRSFHF